MVTCTESSSVKIVITVELRPFRYILIIWAQAHAHAHAYAHAQAHARTSASFLKQSTSVQATRVASDCKSSFRLQEQLQTTRVPSDYKTIFIQE